MPCGKGMVLLQSANNPPKIISLRTLDQEKYCCFGHLSTKIIASKICYNNVTKAFSLIKIGIRQIFIQHPFPGILKPMPCYLMQLAIQSFEILSLRSTIGYYPYSNGIIFVLLMHGVAFTTPNTENTVQPLVQKRGFICKV